MVKSVTKTMPSYKTSYWGNFSRLFKASKIDWLLFFSTLPLLGAGLISMRALGVDPTAGGDYYFYRQLIWIIISISVFFLFSFIDWRFLKRGELLFLFYSIAVAVLVALFIFGKATRGAVSWIDFSLFSVEPSDPIKLLLIIILAKYFSRRHIEIAHIRHIIVSGVYVLIPTVLIFFQPDLGSAIILFAIWLGMIMVSGVSKKHLLLVALILLLVFSTAWLFVFKPYQKERIVSFLHPLQDIRGAGYNAAQSVIAVGSGQFLGKGIGFGTQSRLEFLPEHQTDFIFAAFAEEWGFVGIMFVFTFWGIIIWRILKNSFRGRTNFESLFGIGLCIFLISHFVIHVGMNIGLMPVTGITLPFMSYGGSHMLTVFAGLGILMGMNKYSRSDQYEKSFANILKE